jgi:hypothetical protein
MMGVFNNLVMYDQHVPQNSLQSIVPDLASGWSWNEDGTELTLPLQKVAGLQGRARDEAPFRYWTRKEAVTVTCRGQDQTCVDGGHGHQGRDEICSRRTRSGSSSICL